MEFTHDLQLACHTETKARQVKKFANLKEQQGRAVFDPFWRVTNQTRTNVMDKWVKNLSDRVLSKHEVSVLAKGNNFAVVDR